MGWEPGKSGNPKGRPPIKYSITQLIREKLDREEFVNGLIDLATNPMYPPELRLRAKALIMSYTDGLPVQAVKTSIEDNRKPRIVVSLPDNQRGRTVDEPAPATPTE